MDKENRENPGAILEKKIERIRRKREWKHFFIECAVLTAAVYVTFHYIIGIAFVGGHSMEPALKDGDMVLFYRLDKEYQKDDIVIVRKENEIYYIKRIAACGGERVTVNEEGLLMIGPEVEAKTFPMTDGITFPYEVPERAYSVMGDNRPISKDSRIFGAVKEEEIVGRVFLHLGMVW